MQLSVRLSTRELPSVPGGRRAARVGFSKPIVHTKACVQSRTGRRCVGGPCRVASDVRQSPAERFIDDMQADMQQGSPVAADMDDLRAQLSQAQVQVPTHAWGGGGAAAAASVLQ